MKAKVIFKNVGQGDTIILEVVSGNLYKIGIIDCKLTKVGVVQNKEDKKQNVVEEYLEKLKKENKKFSIEFVAISHPHQDHYDGMASLFEYFYNEKIHVNTIYHTFLLRTVVERYVPVSFGKLYNKFTKALADYSNCYNEQSEMSSSSQLIFDEDKVKITCFSPSDEEKTEAILQLLIQATEKKGRKLVSKINKFSNFKSSILKIDNKLKGESVLLTSDAEKSSFIRINKSFPNKKSLFWDTAYNFISVQIPHHGSIENYEDVFWDNVKKHSPNTEVIISVGDNIYNHPSPEVKEKLNKTGYKSFTKPGDSDSFHSLDYISCVSYNDEKDVIINFKE